MPQETQKRPTRDDQILALLNKLGDRLIRSETERKQMAMRLNSLSAIEAQFPIIDARTTRAENAVQSMQARVDENARNLAARQTQMETQLRASAAQAERIQDIAQRLHDALEQNNRLARKLEQVTQERARMVRKLERIEESVIQTRDALNAKAFVLLTDQAAAARAVPASLSDTEKAARQKFSSLFFPEGWRRWDRGLPAAGVAAMVMLALFGGWAVQQNFKTTGAAMRLQTVAQAPQADIDAPAAQDALEIAVAPDADNNPFAENPDEAQLNEIAPAAGPVPGDLSKPAGVEEKAPAAAIENASLTSGDNVKPSTGADQFADADRFLRQESPAGKLSERVKPDNSLPPVVKEIEKKAFEGVPEAQHDLAAIYTAGHGGVKIDMKKALIWFREAAVNGVPNARYNLGVLYQQGLGTDKDIDKAVGWYRAAAKLGHPEAQYNLGIAHIEGIGAPYDPVMAAHFFERAARGGIPEAAYNLGLIHENGLIGKQDNKEALFWYSEAAQRNSPEAQTALNQLMKTMNIRASDIPSMFRGRAGMPQADKSAVRKDKKAQAPAIMETAPEKRAEATETGKTQTMVAQIQEQLIRMKLFPGPANGVLDSRTADAIRAYQKQSGISTSGRASDALLAHMIAFKPDMSAGIEPGGLSSEDMPPPGEFAKSN